MADRSNACDVSVVVPTRNRSPLVRIALDSLLAQSANGVRYEVLVVDNNSTDDTARTVATYGEVGHIRYLFEAREGPSHARNRGVEESSAPIVAFTDDDVRVSESWVARLKSTFDRHADVDCVGGRVLPEWPDEPPSWMTKSHWGPLALVDYGPAPLRTDTAPPLCLLTANMAVRRSAIVSVGGFDSQYLRCQDHELQIRLWQNRLPLPLRSRTRRHVACRSGTAHQDTCSPLVPPSGDVPRQDAASSLVQSCGRRALDPECAAFFVSAGG